LLAILVVLIPDKKRREDEEAESAIDVESEESVLHGRLVS
jgi:hypothetical protein